MFNLYNDNEIVSVWEILNKKEKEGEQVNTTSNNNIHDIKYVI